MGGALLGSGRPRWCDPSLKLVETGALMGVRARFRADPVVLEGVR